MKDDEEMMNMVNRNHERLEKARLKSVGQFQTDYSTRKQKKINKILVISSLIVLMTFGVKLGIQKIDNAVDVKRATDYQRQEIFMMIYNQTTDFNENQMLGMISLFGEEGADMVASDLGYENYQDWCNYNGYCENILDSNSNVIGKKPSLKVAQNYLEPEAIKRMETNTVDGKFVFPDVEAIKGGNAK